MSEQGKYGEPWEMEFDEYGGYDCMSSAWKVGHKTTFGFHSLFGIDCGQRDEDPEAKAKAARIVSCVNALAGRNPEKLDVLIEAVRDMSPAFTANDGSIIVAMASLEAALAAFEASR